MLRGVSSACPPGSNANATAGLPAMYSARNGAWPDSVPASVCRRMYGVVATGEPAPFGAGHNPVALVHGGGHSSADIFHKALHSPEMSEDGCGHLRAFIALAQHQAFFKAPASAY